LEQEKDDKRQADGQQDATFHIQAMGLLMRYGVVARTAERVTPREAPQAVPAALEDAVTDHRLLHEVGAAGNVSTSA
jgi:hypothetical protein